MRYLVILSVLICSISASAATDRHPEFPTYFANSNGISIAYQDFGDPKDETVLLVMGLGAQLIHWHDDFVMALVDAGYRVIRFDNRDIGLSEKFYDQPTIGIITGIRYKLGMSLNAPYHLDDMAADGIGLLDHLNINKAHIAGVSMGGMIAQIMAGKYPDRVLSLTSIMSTSGAEHLPQGSLEVDTDNREGATREESIQRVIETRKAIYGKDAGLSEAEWYAKAERSYDRSHYADGFSRQFWAIVDSGDRVELLKSIKLPTLVIHGKIDPLIPLEHGEHTAEMVPDAELVVLDDMGHTIGVEHHKQVLEPMLEIMQKARYTADN